MTSEKNYIPIVTPMTMCIPQIPKSQIIRVLPLQMKNRYPNSSRQTRIPANGYFHVTTISGSMTSNGGRMRARHTFNPSHQPLPRAFCQAAKKKKMHK
jgi:hypothetical protein